MDDLNGSLPGLLPRETEAWISSDQMTFGFQVIPDEAPAPLFEIITRHGTFRTVRQPIIRLADEQAVGYEMLSRSSMPGSPMPEDFLRFCLANNMLGAADLYCLGNCVSAPGEVSPQLRRHINLYPSTLLRTPVGRILEAFPTGAQSGSFCVELNEHFILNDPGELGAPIDTLKRAGILIAIDDVGFGRSSLESIILLEPDILKIDKKLVIGIAHSEKRLRSLERLLGVARSLHAQAIAEGIENEDDLRVLRELGVSYGQGFLWGKPA